MGEKNMEMNTLEKIEKLSKKKKVVPVNLLS